MRQIALFAAAICLHFLTGCFPLIVPKVDYTPPVNLEARREEVHAFRVDFTNEVDDIPFGPGVQQLTEIPASNTDEIPAQIKPSITYGIVVIGIALNYFINTNHDMTLRLYRPGYELVEIKSWKQKHRVTWKPAIDLAAQEHALDALLPATWLRDGSASRAHQNALFYGASEYETPRQGSRARRRSESPRRQGEQIAKDCRRYAGGKSNRIPLALITIPSTHES